MKFGICTALQNAAAAKAGGWDFVEEKVQGLLQAEVPDEQWDGLQRVKAAPLPVRSANVLVPAELKITGPDADPDRLADYMKTVLRRAAAVGMQVVVFGSGKARNVPEGFDRGRARQQIVEFGRSSARIAAEHGVSIVLEHLSRRECNIVDSVAEMAEVVEAVDHPNFQGLVDIYHLWQNDEPLEDVRAALPLIRHVHLADREGRTAPGESGTSDYRPFFRILKEGGYDCMMSVEAGGFDIAATGRRVLEFVKRQWEEA